MPPAFTRGVPPVLKLVAGGVRIPGCRALNRIIFLCLPSLFFVLFCERYVGDELPTVPVCATLTTPLTSAGGKAVYRIDTDRHSPNIPANSNLYSCCVKPIRTFRYSLSGLQTNAEYFFPKSQRIFYIPLDKSRSLLYNKQAVRDRYLNMLL